MTRESLFLATFEPQFAIGMSWPPTCAGLEGGRPIGASDLPGYAIELGETQFTAFDVSGFPIKGRQLFAIRLYWSHPERAVASRLAQRSDYIGQIEAFFAGGYAPPGTDPANPDTIDAIGIQYIDPPSYHKLDTRSVITVRAFYDFTIN
jgi:hypothetical protein